MALKVRSCLESLPLLPTFPFQFVTVLAFTSMVLAGEIVYDHSHHQPHHHVGHEAPAKYEFSYGVHDAHTGDIKEQKESRDGNAVHGFYSVVDPDGYKRTVEYTADEHHGFNAVVKREPLSGHDAPKPIHHHAQPIAKVAHYAAPQVHQPVHHAHYSPVAAPAHHNYYHH